MMEIRNISKRFGTFQALHKVSMRVQAGEINAVVGENGAGKTTLMNILFGLLPPDAGTILFNGAPVRITSPAVARRMGIGMVHQHFKLAPALSAMENIILLAGRGIISGGRRLVAARAAEWQNRLGWRLPLDEPVSRLAIGQRQRVEIIQALCAGGKLLILDEPTASLAPMEVEDLFAALRSLAASGTAVLFISHKLAQVTEICRRITILRRGDAVYTGELAGLTHAMLAEKMIGGNVPQAISRPPPPVGGEARLALADVTVKREASIVLHHVSLQVHSGQIVGIAGVEGNGQSALVECIADPTLPAAGKMTLSTTRDSAPQRTGRRQLFAIIPEDRRTDGLVPGLSVTANMLLKRHHQAPFARWGFLRFSTWRSFTLRRMQEFDIRCPDLDTPVGALSGGNQQKLVLARELSDSPEFILAVNPTRGLDIAATAFVMNQLVRARNAGAAVLLIHADLDELLAVSDRVAVMYEGRLSDTDWPHTSRESIGRLMLGVRA